MNLQDAAEQFFDMLCLGSRALQRLAEQKLDQGELDALEEILSEMLGLGERIKSILKCPPDL